jgi:hypothetical protein
MEHALDGWDIGHSRDKEWIPCVPRVVVDEAAAVRHNACMPSPSGAWHRDPSRRHELRYWDGTRWTEHVSDSAVTSMDPVDGPAPGASLDTQLRGQLLDASLKSDLRAQRLVIDDEALWWKGKRVVLADVTQVTHYVTRIASLLNHTMQYRLELCVGKKRTKVLWDGKAAEAAAVYDAAVAVLRQKVVQRLVRQEMAKLVSAGATVVGGVRFTPEGITQGKQSATWAEISSVQPASDARVVVVAGGRVVAVLDAVVPNTPVATALVGVGMATFGAA